MPQAGTHRLVNLCPETPDRAGRFSRHTEGDSAPSIYADGEAGVRTPLALVTSCACGFSAAPLPTVAADRPQAGGGRAGYVVRRLDRLGAYVADYVI